MASTTITPPPRPTAIKPASSTRFSGPARSRAKHTLEHYQRFAATLRRFDDRTGELVPFELEQWQIDVARDFFAGYPEVLVEVPTGNGKTTFFATLGLHHATYVADNARVLIISATGKQARQMWEAASAFIANSRDLNRWWSSQEAFGGRIKSRTDRGMIEVVTPSPKVAEGEIPSLVLADELHRMADDGAAYSIMASKLQKRGAQILGVTTAGDDEESFWGRKRRQALESPGHVVTGHLVPELRARGAKSTLIDDSATRGDVYRTRAVDQVDGVTVLQEYSLPDGADADDLEQVKRANPSRFVTLATLKQARKLLVTRPWDWLRQHCNRWALGEKSALDSQAWTILGENPVDLTELQGRTKVVALDNGGVEDTTGIAIVWRLDDDADGQPRLVTAAEGRECILVPPGEGEHVHFEDLLAALDQAIDETPGDMLVLAFDPNAGGGYILQQLRKQRPHWKLAPHGQTAEMDDASEMLAKMVTERRLRHDGHPGVTRHVLNAAAKRSRRNKWYIAKPAGQPHRKVDYAVALAMAVRVSLSRKPKRKLRMTTLRDHSAA